MAFLIARLAGPCTACSASGASGKKEDAAREDSKAWRQEYHTERPHRGLGQRTPAEYATLFTPEDERFLTPILRS